MSEERRLVTVLFADVVGSTALGESIDPEDLRALLARYYAVAREVVDAHGGTLEKFIGDAAMAVFGLPLAHDDDANRALSAAIELRDRVRSDPQLGEQLPIRLGLQTGEVVAARDPGADSLVTGDAVNVAARLQQAAEPWSILVGERTANAARGFEFATPRAIDAKGKAVPVACRELVGRASEARMRVPLVGREGDIAQLELIATRAFRERRPFLVSVLAPPGVGKSRLLEEFVDRLPAIATDAEVALAQCLPYGQRLTYWPLRAIVQAILGLGDETTPEVIRTTAARWLAERRDSAAERHADVIAATVGGAEVEGIDRLALAEAWRALVEHATEDRPLVLAVEDLHWSSDSLLDLIEEILQPRGEARLLMVILARPELLDRRPTWGGGRRNYVALSLEPLDDPDVATLVEHLLDGPSPEIVRLVVERAEGNPFYAGEIVRSIVERTADLRDPDGVAGAVRALPDTVQATVLGRIDVLPSAVRRALQLGSVFGRSFSVDGLVALEPDAGNSIRPAVDELVDRDLVRPSTDGVSFRHILIREVAYGTLPRAERARLHGLAADWLTRLAVGREEELAELVAYHYREAATLAGVSGALSPDLSARAVDWLRKAAVAAMAGAANQEAAGHIRSALELATPDEQPSLYELLGDVRVGGDAAIEAYAQALELSDAAGAPPTDRLRLMAAELMVFSRWSGSVARLTNDRVETLRRRGLELLPSVTEPRVRARFLAALAFVPAMIPDLGEVEPRSDAAAAEALRIARELDDANLWSAALDALGAIAMRDDDMAAEVDYASERLGIADRLDATERADAAVVRAWSLVTLGRLQEALATLQPIHEWFGPGQAVTFQFSARAWEVSALHPMGRWDEAVARGRRMAELWNEMRRGAHGYALHGFLRTLEIARARRDAGLEEEFASMALELSGHFENFRRVSLLAAIVRRDFSTVRTRIVADWAVWNGRLDCLDIALAVLADHGEQLDAEPTRALIAHAEARGLRLVEAQARRALGISEADAAELARAADLFAAMDAGGYLPRVQTELGLLRADEALFEEGVAGLERLGDVAQLDRLAERRKAAAGRN